MSRILIVSNRLPISVRRDGEALTVERSAGGLATGLSGVHDKGESLWIGWPGHSETLSADEERSLNERYAALNVVPVPLSATEVQQFYDDFCNGVLWPLLHYMIGQLPLEVTGFEHYEQMNRRFADAVVAEHRRGDTIWVHDYQLMLVPQMIREQIPDARIGFFLHIPFPSSDVFRILPFRERILMGLLGADLIGFHTAAYMRHFASSVLRTLGEATEVETIRWQGRPVHLGVFPMGVDAPGFAAQSNDPAVLEQVRILKPENEQLLVGIDRLDYTKGIPRRLMAFERLLQQHPELRGRVRLVQVAVPSRTTVDTYAEFRAQVDALIGRIHGAFATTSWVPVHYIFRGLPPDEIVALYRAADVMLVTPIRDGMNLVAKEFVATRSDEDGTLVLSEFAGAANELAEALPVNPYDVNGAAETFYRALTMPPEERHTRMRALRRRVLGYDVSRWARTFLDRLDGLASGRARRRGKEPSPPAVVHDALARMLSSPDLVLLLDYDGTLVPFARTPDLAGPDPEVRELLRDLAARPGTEVHVVSGRTRHTLTAWLADLRVTLHGEHGLWTRTIDGSEFTRGVVSDAWREPVLAILRDYVERTPGALVEEKPAGLAWHHRAADPEFGHLQANELRQHLTELLSNAPVEIVTGDNVVEIRPHGVNKGLIVPEIVARRPRALLAAFGDDRTDEDLFAALPDGGIALHVGPGESRAPVRLIGVRDVREILRAIAKAPLPR